MKIIVNYLLLAVFLCAICNDAFSQWTKTATFDNGTNGSIANTTSGFDYAGTATTFTSDRAAGGSKSVKMAWTVGTSGWGGMHGELYYPNYPKGVLEGQEIWARGYYYFKSPWSWGTNSDIKILRIALNAGGQLSIIINGGQILASNELSPGEYLTGTGVSADLDAWNCLEIYAKLKSDNTGILRIWKNGVLIFEKLNHRTVLSGGYAGHSYIMGTWNNGCPANQTQYLDEFIITTERPSKVDNKGNPMIGPIGVATSLEEDTLPGDAVNIPAYPNPFSESTTLDFSDIKKSSGDNLGFYLYNLLGEKVAVHTVSTEKFILERNNLDKGVYLYKVMLNEKYIGTGKLVIQ